MTRNRTQKLTRVYVVIVVIGIIIHLTYWLRSLSGLPTLFDVVEALGWTMILPLVFSILGMMILNQQPRNMVGWLMLAGALPVVNPINLYLGYLLTPPTTLTAGLFIILWVDNWSWMPIIFPIFLIPLYFPTGRLPTPRWKWVPRLALALWLIFAVITPFAEEVGPSSGGWGPLPNPIGFLPTDFMNGPIIIIWGIGLLSIVGGSVVSLFVRYRNAQRLERQQLKWLLYAGALFAVYFGFTFFTADSETDSGWRNFFFVSTIIMMPIAIAIAILRYRLYDIDLIIRRTLQYSIVSAVLVLVYFGSVTLIQRSLTSISGAQSPLAIVISTLVIAALFSPLRRRVQAIVDRRFYRQKYDAAQTLARFGTIARDETDLATLVNVMVNVVEETVQPASVRVWLKHGPGQDYHRLIEANFTSGLITPTTITR
jgi:hypothetical protein